jgi:hypothetical protein
MTELGVITWVVFDSNERTKDITMKERVQVLEVCTSILKIV